MNDFQPLDPPRFEYIDAVQKPEIDYKSAYELQRITTKKTALTAIRLVEGMERIAATLPSNELMKEALIDLAETKTCLSNILLET